MDYLLLISTFGLPLIAAVIFLFMPKQTEALIRPIAQLLTGFAMLIAVVMFVSFDSSSAFEGVYQFGCEFPFASSVGISLGFGVDGLSIGLILMGAIVGFASTCCAWEIQKRQKEFYVLLMLMIGGIQAAFASTDLFMFYFFHEFALIPTFIMIGVWGRGIDPNYAAWKITLYLVLGSLIALAGLIALYLQQAEGERTFHLLRMAANLKAEGVSIGAQNIIFPLLMFGFGILVSLWPFHTWAPLGYASAPTATAMMHAGVIKKFGLYGIIRVAIPMLPDGAHAWMHVLALLCLGNILYCGLVAMRQKDLNLLIGNSSVAHMGFVFLGIASLTVVGLTGAVVVMVAHGLLAALSFGLSGHLYSHSKSIDMEKMGGLMNQIPLFGVALIMAMMAGCGLPGFGNFIGEAMVFIGAWTIHPLATVFAVWGGLVIGGVYMLRAIRNILHGPRNENWTTDSKKADGKVRFIEDLDWVRGLPFALLLAALLLFGFFPRLLTDKINMVTRHIGNNAPVALNVSAIDVRQR